MTATPAAFRRGRRTTLRLTLSEAATVVLRFERVRRGRVRAGRCVTGARRGRRCTRYTPLTGTFTRALEAGTQSIAFGGTLARRSLSVGTYRITAVATDAAGNASAARSVTFRILPRRTG
jgi:hypothetical protein